MNTDKDEIGDGEIRPEYDLTKLKGKVRGKYVRRYQTDSVEAKRDAKNNESFPPVEYGKIPT